MVFKLSQDLFLDPASCHVMVLKLSRVDVKRGRNPNSTPFLNMKV
jgi:hypothetical protein